MSYTLTELQSIIDANGGKSVFDLKKGPKRDLRIEQKTLETYPTATVKGKTLTNRYSYIKKESDTAAYAAFVVWAEIYFTAIGYENIETAVAAYWNAGTPLSTMTV